MKQIYFLAFIAFYINTFAQTNSQSTLKEQSEYYKTLGIKTDAEWDIINDKKAVAEKSTELKSMTVCNLNKRVFGWHPYWVGTAYNNYQWNLLSDMCYFSYDVDPATGANTNGSFAWTTSNAVTTAINNGTDVHFCVTLFGSHATFFGSASAKQTLITNIINLLNARNAKGVNIDFEGMGASSKAPFTAFMQDLCNQVHAANANYEVSVCLYAVDWSGVFDIPNLDPYLDLYTIMGYDYYYSGSSTAGPEAPLYNFQTSYNYTLSRSITYYLSQGATNSKLLLGLPWYGREWETAGNTAPSATTGGFTSSRTYAYVRNNPTTYSGANKRWESNSFNPFYVYQSAGNWRQCWIDDAFSMRKKFDLVNQRGIGGIGIWALGYDDGYTDYWDAIEAKFTDCAVAPCTDTLYDMGGPNRNHYDKERYTYTIQPTGSSNVSMTFTQFDLETNYDSLWIYNGTSISSPLIGAYTSTNSPGTVTSTNGALTLRFKSDNLTTNSGFTAIYNCIIDNVAPTTTLSAPTGWITQNFTTNFTDTDNASGTGVEKSFYQVLEFNGTEWRANKSRGFFSDNFDTAIHPDWTSYTGTWAINGAYLEQSDEALGNTNIAAACTQTLSNRYLYNWQAKMSGTGTNRRAGFHFFCDSASTTNRYNSYFAWFRLDDSVVEIYKVTNDVFSLVNSTPYTFATNTFYDYTVSFDRISGDVQIWINNSLVSTWNDANPHTVGKYISFRGGNCVYTVNNLKVYRSRAASVNVTVGSASTNDIRYENTSPTTPAARIKSIIKDGANNLSTIASQDLNVDWTKPIASTILADGASTDIDTTYIGTQLVSNYTAARDTNSGVTNYWYAIGTTPGAQNITAWTSNATALNATQTGLTLVGGTHYYFMVKAQNAAGLVSDSIVSDGVIYLTGVGLNELATQQAFSFFPNPAKGNLNITLISDENEKATITFCDITGKQLLFETKDLQKGMNKYELNLTELNLAGGTYILNIKAGQKLITRKIVVTN